MKSARRLAVEGVYALLRAKLHPPLEACSTLVEVVRLAECIERFGIDCVLDVGANEGQFATRLRRLGYRGWIHSFEPNPDAFAGLERAHARDPRWRGHPFALGSADERRSFQMHRNSSLSSFLDPVGPAVVTTATVEVRTLASVLPGLLEGAGEPRILLKMDTQGWDLEVVRGAGAALDRIAALLSELSVQPLYDGMTSYHEALRHYTERGFVLYDVTPINRDPDGVVVECDCLMVRPERALRRR